MNILFGILRPFFPTLEPDISSPRELKNGERAFAELIEYLEPEDVKELELRLSEVPFDSEIAQQILEGEWELLFQNPDFPIKALHCLREGLISSMAFSTSQMFYNVYNHPNNKIVRIESAFLNENMIDQTLEVASDSLKAYLIAAIGIPSLFLNPRFKEDLDERIFSIDIAKREETKEKFLSVEEKEKFYSILKTMPFCEHRFLLVPDPLFDGTNIVQEHTVVQSINYFIGFNVFSRLMINGVPMVMIPSRGMTQAYLEATHDDLHIHQVFRFRLSPYEGMLRTMESGGRDMFQSFACLPHLIPKEADGLLCLSQTAESEIHDVFHINRVADIPLNDFKFFLFLAKKLLEIASSEYVSLLAEGVTDMDHQIYGRMRIRSDKPFENFWTSISILDNYVFDRQWEERRDLAKLLAYWLIENERKIEILFGMKFDDFYNVTTYKPNELVSLIKDYLLDFKNKHGI